MTDDRRHLPSYAELPLVEGGARSGWHLFGDDDQRGLMNLQSTQTVRDAASLVRSGEVFPLDLPRGLPDPAFFHRSAPRRTTLEVRESWYFDDVLDNDYPQAGSQWDSLGHIGYRPDVFYNGATADDIRSGRRNGIHHWAQHGIVGRGVLLDLTKVRDIDPTASQAISVDDLEAARAHAGVEFRPGDVVILRTGFLEHHLTRPLAERRHQAQRSFTSAPGLEHTEEMAEYLWNTHASGFAADNPTVEVFPPDESAEAWPFGYLHYVLIGQFGLALGELWWVADLAQACAADGRYEFLLTSAPTHTVGGIGGHANVLAIR